MLYMEIIAVCSEIHTKHINLPRRNLNTKICGTHWACGMVHVKIILKANLLLNLTCVYVSIVCKHLLPEIL